MALADTPPHARLAGDAVTARVGSCMRLGLELLHAHRFGFEYYERRATLINPVVEYRLSPRGRVSPYLTGCLGFTLYRSLFPTGPDAQLEWEYGGAFNLGGGAGMRRFPDETALRGAGSPSRLGPFPAIDNSRRLSLLISDHRQVRLSRRGGDSFANS